jgi:hypothetical protein
LWQFVSLFFLLLSHVDLAFAFFAFSAFLSLSLASPLVGKKGKIFLHKTCRRAFVVQYQQEFINKSSTREFIIVP